MKLFHKAADGGKNSGVTGYFLIEWKHAFSVVLLRFNKGTREAFHSHAFNAVTWWLKGCVVEMRLPDPLSRCVVEDIYRAGQVKYTPRRCFHKINALETTWALSFRGPWADRWQERRAGKLVTLTHGRREVP